MRAKDRRVKKAQAYFTAAEMKRIDRARRQSPLGTFVRDVVLDAVTA